MTLGQRIKDLREEQHFTQEEFAKKIGISKSAIGMYETNKREPNLETLDAIADFFNVDMDYLRGKTDCRNRFQWAQENRLSIPSGFQPIPKMVKRPLVGRIACGDPILAEENIEAYVDVPEEINCDFVLTCSGDSMIDAGISDGDQVYIHIQPKVENGQIAAVRIGDDATLKRVYWDGTTLMLMPANAKYPPKSYSGEDLEAIQIEGRAVGFTHWF